MVIEYPSLVYSFAKYSTRLFPSIFEASKPGTFSITPSFLEELFTNIVKEYGIEKFRETVHIEPNGYNIEVPLEEALDRILQDKNALQR